MSLEENPTFLILYLNVNLEQHLVVVHHDDFDQKMVHIPVQVDHFVEEIQALQRPLTTLSRSHVVENYIFFKLSSRLTVFGSKGDASV